jgi:hypothetical protein
VIEVPLDPAVEQVLDEVTGSDDPVIVELLGTRLKAEPAGMVANSVSGLDLFTSPISIDRAVPLEQANREAELHGAITVRCEYLLLALDSAIDTPELDLRRVLDLIPEEDR